MWQRTTHRWESPNLLGRSMELVVHGHAGARVLVFPTSMGRFHEWEDQGMAQLLADQLSAGHLQLICVASVDAESWYDDHAHPHQQAEWHARYDAYLRDEVVPFTLASNPNPFLITMGASFGAYHALAFGCRYPHLVSRVLAMSGLVDIKRLTHGYSDDLVYAYNPADFMRHEHDPVRLEAFRRMDIILAVGRDDPLRPGNEAFSRVLWERGIGNALRLWDGWAHDWPWWKQMVRLYIGGHD